MTPNWGNTVFSSVPPSNSLVSVSDPSRALDSPRVLLPELQRYKDAIKCGALGAEVPGHRQEQLRQTLIVRLLKTHFSPTILDCEKL